MDTCFPQAVFLTQSVFWPSCCLTKCHKLGNLKEGIHGNLKEGIHVLRQGSGGQKCRRGARDVTQLVECSPSMQRTLGLRLSPALSAVADACNPGGRGRRVINCKSSSVNQFKTGLGYANQPTTITTKNKKEAFRHSFPCFGHHKKTGTSQCAVWVMSSLLLSSLKLRWSSCPHS